MAADVRSMFRRIHVSSVLHSSTCRNNCLQAVRRGPQLRQHRHVGSGSSRCSRTAARSLTQAKEQGTGIDLSVAVALAAAAFEAYLEPTGAEGLQDRAANGTETTYTDSDFLASQFKGLLQLTVHSAEGLAAVNLTGDTSDPYVVASVGSSCRVTPVVWGSTNPVWQATLPLYIRDAAADVLQLQVMDKGNVWADQVLGTAAIPVHQLVQGAAAEACQQHLQHTQQQVQQTNGDKDNHEEDRTATHDVNIPGRHSSPVQPQEQASYHPNKQQQQQQHTPGHERGNDRGHNALHLELEGGPGHITISATWLPFDDPGRLDQVVAADKDLPPPPAELVAVGSAVAAVTALPAQAADQLKAAAEQVTEATQLLKHQTQEVAEVLQPVLTTAAKAVETLQPLVAGAMDTLADTAAAATAAAAAAMTDDGKDTQLSLTALGSAAADDPPHQLQELASPAAAEHAEAVQPCQQQQGHQIPHQLGLQPQTEGCTGSESMGLECCELVLEDHSSIGSSNTCSSDKQWSSALFEDAASSSSNISSLSSSDDEVVLEEVVTAAKDSALQALDQGITSLQHQLTAAGLDDTGGVLEPLKEAAAAQVTSAATSVTQYVTCKGLGSLPVSDLSKLLASVQQLQQEGKEAREAAAKAAAAQAANFAQRGPLDTITATGGMEELLLQADVSSAARGFLGTHPPLTPELMPSAWRALTKAAGKMVDDIFTPVAYLDNPGSDTQVWIHVSRGLREVVVAFRGTEQVKWKDLAADINLIPTSLDDEGGEGATSASSGDKVHLGPIPLPLATFKKNKQVMVHSGFLAAYNSVKDQVLSLVSALTAGASPGDPWVIWVTGHSLGGALATLCAYELAGRSPALRGAQRVIMYTYGAPRVGNKAFADAFDTRLSAAGAAWRITNIRDIVPTVPRLMGYAHGGSSVRLTGGGGLLVGAAAEADVLVEGREVLEVLGELASKALKVAAGAAHPDTLMTPFQRHEMAVLNSLVDGSALEQHMEDFYLLTLKDCVLAAAPQLRPVVEEALAAAVADATERVTATAAEQCG